MPIRILNDEGALDMGSLRKSAQKQAREGRARVNDLQDKAQQRANRRNQSISLERVSPLQRAAVEEIMSERLARGSKSLSLQTVFRNEQRNLTRDIKSTQRALSKADRGSYEYMNLSRRLTSLQTLSADMKKSAEHQGVKRANSLSTRMGAFITYMNDFKGKQRMAEQRQAVKPLSMDAGQQRFYRRVINKYGDTPAIMTPALQDLMIELESAIRRYDSAQASEILTTMNRMTGDEYMQTREYTSRHAQGLI